MTTSTIVGVPDGHPEAVFHLAIYVPQDASDSCEFIVCSKVLRNPTRGQVRTACRLFGIELKEPKE